MAWKNPKDEMLNDETNSNSINLIGPGTIIKGDVSSDGDLRIDGKVIGTISSKSKVVVGATGIVEGDIKSQNTDIFGSHKGNIHATDMVFLKSTANLEGDINTSKIVIEAGAIFKGRCNMGTTVAAATSKDLKKDDTATQPTEHGGKGFEKVFN